MGYMSKYGPWYIALKDDPGFSSALTSLTQGNMTGMVGNLRGVEGTAIMKGFVYSAIWNKAKQAWGVRDPF